MEAAGGADCAGVSGGREWPPSLGDAAYPLKLLQRVITVSLETMKIVKSLPKLDI